MAHLGSWPPLCLFELLDRASGWLTWLPDLRVGHLAGEAGRGQSFRKRNVMLPETSELGPPAPALPWAQVGGPLGFPTRSPGDLAGGVNQIVLLDDFRTGPTLRYPCEFRTA